MIEPWATEVTIPSGVRFAVHYPQPSDCPDTSFAEIHPDMIRFWCEGDTFEVELDGQIIQT